MAKTNITFPVGRLVQGSLYKPSETDQQGQPLVVKYGPNKGQPRVDYWFRVAIPKGSETHWANTPWGQQIWNIGHAAFPNVAGAPGFSWKIDDGDDATQNIQRKGKRNVDIEGWAGNWVVKFSGGFAPKIYRVEGGGHVQIMEIDAVKAGYYIEVAGSVDGNANDQKPGVYLNHSLICLRAYGPEIQFGQDVASAGFGQSALPAGASITPPPSAAPMPGIPPQPGSYAPPPVPGSYAPPPVMVAPNPGFLQMPAPAVQGTPAIPAPMAPPAPPATYPSNPARQMTAAANGVTYEAYIASGWTDVQLIQNGLMVA